MLEDGAEGKKEGVNSLVTYQESAIHTIPLHA